MLNLWLSCKVNEQVGGHAPKSGAAAGLARAIFIRFYRFLGGYTPKKHWIFSRETGWSCSEFCTMDMNWTFESWSKARLVELETERNIFWPYNWEPFEIDAKTITVRKFGKLLDYFKGVAENNIVEEMVPDLGNRDYIRKRIDGRFDFDKIVEMASNYETSLVNWRIVREQITLILPKAKQKSYREITRHMHSRLYDNLLGLKEIQY